MKLLLDENISYRIKKQLLTDFPDTIHVFEISKERLSDLEIWNYAKKNHFKKRRLIKGTSHYLFQS